MVRQVTKPTLEDLAGLANGVSGVEMALRRIVVLTVELMLFGWLISTAVIWWDRVTVSQLRTKLPCWRPITPPG